MSLLRAIKENNEIRRLFGKREIDIVEKQLLGVNLSPSEKTRQKMSISHIGVNTWQKGRKASEETKTKRSTSMKLYWKNKKDADSI